MRQAVSRAVKDGMPVIAECGGFMYLHERLQGEDGKEYGMAGVLHGECHKTSGLARFGYILPWKRKTTCSALPEGH